MLACGSDNPEVRTINLIGMRRAGISEPTIRTIKRAHRLVFREHKRIAEVRKILTDELEGIIPLELNTLLTAIEQQSAGKQGRAREAVRDASPVASQQSKAA
jgi:UDP-N-acetylglucosamine acyltransferase